MLLILTACGSQESVTLYKGTPGSNGNPGATGKSGNSGMNGHSLVSEYTESCQLECSNGGTRLDLYLDMDDSLSVSEGDLYSNSLVVCNGSDGLNGQSGIAGEMGPQGEAGPQGLQGESGEQGSQGPQGEAGPSGPQGESGDSDVVVTALTGSSCTLVAGSSPSYYVKSDSLYSESGCSNSDKVALQVGETVFVAPRVLVIKDSSGLRSINFN